MDDASSAYDSAENTQASAASANDKITAGPAIAAPSPITTKIPVPMMAPTPIAVSCHEPTARLSSWPVSCVSVSSEETSRVANRPGFFLPTTSVISLTSTWFGLYRASVLSHHPERLKACLLLTRTDGRAGDNPRQSVVQPVPPILPGVTVPGLDITHPHVRGFEDRHDGSVRNDQRFK